MNKLILSIVLFLLLACSNRSESSHKKEQASKEQVVNESDSLQLNNGKKWKLDDASRRNMALIKALLGERETKDFEMLATELQQKTNKLVSECTMEGPDHKALHLWLNGWLEGLRGFKAPSDRRSVISALQKDLAKFDDYFE